MDDVALFVDDVYCLFAGQKGEPPAENAAGAGAGWSNYLHKWSGLV